VKKSMFILLLCTDALVVVGVDACFPIWSWEIKSEVKLAVNTDLTVKYHDLIHMAFWSHDIVPLILKRIVQECKSNIGHYKKGGMCPLANCAYTIEIKSRRRCEPRKFT
jgi:hypothetical protein